MKMQSNTSKSNRLVQVQNEVCCDMKKVVYFIVYVLKLQCDKNCYIVTTCKRIACQHVFPTPYRLANHNSHTQKKCSVLQHTLRVPTCGTFCTESIFLVICFL